MGIIEAIAQVFEIGCGVRLEHALASERYAELEALQNDLSHRYPDDTDQGIALRRGHLLIGRLLNAMSESKALEAARRSEPPLGLGIEMRSIIQLLGEHLVRAADACLTDELTELADEWREATAERQIKIIQQLYFLLRSSGQEVEGDLSIQSALKQHRERVARHYDADPVQILPGLYGAWNKENAMNCQGKAQLLCAFARRAGARVLTGTPVENVRDHMNGWRSEAYDLISCDIQGRGLEVDPELRESLMGFALQRRYNEMFFSKSFHICVAMELCDGRWILIDPHSLSWGVLNKSHEMPKIAALLHKYIPVTPGVSITASNDSSVVEDIRQQQLGTVKELIARSHRLEAVINLLPDPSEIIDFLVMSREALFIFEGFGGRVPKCSQEEVDLVLRLLAFQMLTGDKGSFPSPFALIKLMAEPSMLRERVNVLVTTYHSIAMNGLRDQLSDQGLLTHPVIEFSDPEYSLALSAAHWMSGGNDDRFFLEYEYSQIVLYRAMRTEFAGLARATLKSLPIRHPLCDDALNWR